MNREKIKMNLTNEISQRLAAAKIYMLRVQMKKRGKKETWLGEDCLLLFFSFNLLAKRPKQGYCGFQPSSTLCPGQFNGQW